MAAVPEKSWVLCSHETMPQQSSSGPDSFAFPELPGIVRSFARMPLKAVLQLPAGACSVPGPLEESLLRCSVHTVFAMRMVHTTLRCASLVKLLHYTRWPVGMLLWDYLAKGCLMCNSQSHLPGRSHVMCPDRL